MQSRQGARIPRSRHSLQALEIRRLPPLACRSEAAPVRAADAPGAEVVEIVEIVEIVTDLADAPDFSACRYDRSARIPL